MKRGKIFVEIIGKFFISNTWKNFSIILGKFFGRIFCNISRKISALFSENFCTENFVCICMENLENVAWKISIVSYGKFKIKTNMENRSVWKIPSRKIMFALHEKNGSERLQYMQRKIYSGKYNIHTE